MRTFVQLITEDFFDSVKSNLGYTEIFINPSHNELKTLSPPLGKSSTHYTAALDKYGGVPFFTSAAYITPTVWYAWNRDSGTHQMIEKELGKRLDPAAVPIYYHYFPVTKTLVISVAEFSLSPERRSELSIPNVKALVKAHPRMQWFMQKHVVKQIEYMQTLPRKAIYNPLDD